MFNFNINQQVVTFLNQRFGEVGEVTAFDFSRGNVSISLALKGEPEVVTLEVADLCYSVSDGKMNLYFSELRCPENEPSLLGAARHEAVGAGNLPDGQRKDGADDFLPRQHEADAAEDAAAEEESLKSGDFPGDVQKSRTLPLSFKP